MNDKKIVITGIGPISSLGIGKTQIWDSVVKAQVSMRLDKYIVDKGIEKEFYTHRLKNFDLSDFGLNQNIIKDIDSWKKNKNWQDLKHLLAVIKLALDDSKLQFDPKDIENNIGLVIAHENPGLDEFYEKVITESYNLLKDNRNISKEEYFSVFFEKIQKQAYDLQTFMFLFHAAKSFGIHGYSLFVNNACASGLYAIEAAADIIKSGKCDAVIVAAIDRTSIFKLLWFSELGLYPKDGLIKPFAKDRDGFIFGEGGAGLVIESLEHAKKRKAKVYAEYLGGGFSLEGWKVTISDLTSRSYEKTISEALDRCLLKKEDIDLLVPHGVGTSITDAYEAKTISAVFGKKANKPLITALKPYSGHNLGSCALLETAILMMALETGIVPRTLNIKEIDKKLNIDLVTENCRPKLKTIMKLACGFAGYNAASIFRKI